MDIARRAFIAGVLVVAVGCSGREASGPRRLILEHVTVISPGAARRPDMSVAIAGDRILAIGANLEPRSADSVIDGRGRFLVPGLIDGHVHLALPAGLPFPPADLREPIREYFAQLPRSYLYHGFTTLVDLAVVDRAALDRFRGAPAHPDLYDCGPALPVENGYPMVMFPPSVARSLFPNYLANPRQRSARDPRDTVDHSPKAAVDRAVASGAICIKTFFEDGFGEASDWPTPTAAMMEAVRAEAKARNVVLAMHANSYLAWRFASAVPVDLIVHGMWNWDRQPADGDSIPAGIRAVLDSVLARRIAFMPTLRVLEGLAALYDSTFLADPRLAKVLPASVLAWYRSEPARAYAVELAEGRPDARVRAGILGGVEQAARVTRYLVARGGRLVFGSDTPSGPTYGNPPGLNGYLELARLAAARVPLDRLQAAATIETARAFGLESLYGTVEVGKVANLLLLAADPLESVTAYDAIELVVVRGRPIERAALAVASP